MAVVRLAANRLCICAGHGLFIPPVISPEVPATELTVTLGNTMALLSKVFTTRILVQIILVLTAAVMMKAMSSHYDFSWASALAQG
jgi:hypothetical protein